MDEVEDSVLEEVAAAGADEEEEAEAVVEASEVDAVVAVEEALGELFLPSHQSLMFLFAHVVFDGRFDSGGRGRGFWCRIIGSFVTAACDVNS